MSDSGDLHPVKQRRWAAFSKREGAQRQTEDEITPDEARAAINALLIPVGCMVADIYGYDYNTDKYNVRAVNADGKVFDTQIPGEYVGDVVDLSRTLLNTKGKALIRPSELAARHAAQKQTA